MNFETIRGTAVYRHIGFYEFVYQRDVPVDLDIWALDPYRIDPMHEYPRYKSKPTDQNLKVVQLFDFEIRFVEPSRKQSDPFIKSVEVYLVGNSYTANKREAKIFEMLCQCLTESKKSLEDYILQSAFSRFEHVKSSP